MITKEEVKLFMMNFNITDIAADFSGGGDDGDIDNFDFLRDDVVIELEKKDKRKYLEKLLEFFYEILHTELNEKGYDWINNEGGYGTITYNLSTDKYTVDYNERLIDEYNWDYNEKTIEEYNWEFEY